jgi:signal transduction histidine kinase
MRIFIRGLIVIILVSFALNSFSQNAEDSLRKLLIKAKDTSRINVLNQLSVYYSERNDSISLGYANKAIELSDRLNFLKGKANALNTKGIVYDILGNYDSALFYYNNSLKIANTIQNNQLKANVSNNIGLVYWNKGQFEKALNAYFISLKINEKVNNRKNSANVLSNIGLIYNDLKKFKLALKYHFQALEIKEELKDNYGVGVALNNIGITYEDLDSMDLSLKYFFKAIFYQKLANDLYGLAITYNNIGTTYFYQGNKTEALKYHFMALPIRIQLNDDLGLITTYDNIAEVYRAKGELKTSLMYCLKSLELTEKLKSNKMSERVYKLLYVNYKDIGDYKKSLFYMEKYDEVKDSIYTIESAKNLSEMQTKYDTEKKEIENIKLLKENEIKELRIAQQRSEWKFLFVLFLVIGFILILTSFFIVIRYKQKQKAEFIKENSRQEKLRFKAVIDSEEKERTRISKELHDGLGQLLSSAKLNISSLEDGIMKEDEYLLQNSLTIIDDAVKEVRSISHNLMPTALMNYGIIEAVNGLVSKINDSKQIQVNFSNENFTINLEKETEIALYRITQEILNNMLKHSKAKDIDMVFSNSNNNVSINIKDNGIGFNTDEIKNSSGIGWQNIFSRVSMLNGEILINSQIGNGTDVQINFNA